MDAEQRADAAMGAGPSSEFASHEIRITQGGKIRAWVEFALKFFEDNEERALVLHTLPENENDQGDPQEADVIKKETRSGLSTITIPRLITVVEIIKREYLAAMNAKRSPHVVGLFQYNEMGSLEDQVENEREEGEEEDSAGDRMKMIAEALQEAKMTLCRKELAGMKDSGATTQAPLKRKMSRSAKGRMKKRLRKGSENENRE
ncbi:hypothetical protein BGY98DRAFT_1009702 [Russula aff. rugulosa BPL654]|nr:hypothetical protein BGY98DRAFT_1009702 [Russula aff. rugulosa BPL654]